MTKHVTAAKRDKFAWVLTCAGRLFDAPVDELCRAQRGSNAAGPQGKSRRPESMHWRNVRLATTLVAYDYTGLRLRDLSRGLGYGMSGAAGGAGNAVSTARRRIASGEHHQLVRYYRALTRAVTERDPTRCPWCERPMHTTTA